MNWVLNYFYVIYISFQTWKYANIFSLLLESICYLQLLPTVLGNIYYSHYIQPLGVRLLHPLLGVNIHVICLRLVSESKTVKIFSFDMQPTGYLPLFLPCSVSCEPCSKISCWNEIHLKRPRAWSHLKKIHMVGHPYPMKSTDSITEQSRICQLGFEHKLCFIQKAHLLYLVFGHFLIWGFVCCSASRCL